MITQKDIEGLFQAVNDMAELRSENKAIKKENEFYKELLTKQLNLPVVRVMLPGNAVPHDIAKEFTDAKLKVVRGMLSDDYKTGYREGITHYLEDKGN